MHVPEIPFNEAQRLRVLQSLNILDTPPEERFDRLTRITRHLLQTPIVLISLIDEKRQWFKSRQGLEATETPREISFCGHAIHGSEILCVPDASADPRFADNPLVTHNPHIRFYAGAPLEIEAGQRVGTLCIIASEPRQLTAAEAVVLQDLAQCVVAELRADSVLRVAQQLKDLEEYLHVMLQTLVNGVVVIDAQGTIQTINPAVERIFGYTLSELQGQNVKMLMPEPYHSAHDGYLHHYLSGGPAQVIGLGREVMGRRQDGSTFPMELAVGEMRVGEARMFVGIVTDITLRKTAEEAIAQKNRELLALNQLKNQFLGMAAHDLRNPLSALQGISTLLLEAPLLQESVKREFLTNIQSASEQMLALVNDLLDVSVIESGHFVLKRRSGSLARLVAERVRLARFTAQTKGMTIEYADNLLAFAAFDADRLAQVVDNVLSNAIKFAPAGSRVWVELMDEPDHVGFAVTDQGPGISAADRERLFAPFQRLRNRPTGGEKSTGLGLAISHKMVTAHGGSIRVEGVPGGGSRFIVTLPRV